MNGFRLFRILDNPAIDKLAYETEFLMHRAASTKLVDAIFMHIHGINLVKSLQIRVDGEESKLRGRLQSRKMARLKRRKEVWSVLLCLLVFLATVWSYDPLPWSGTTEKLIGQSVIVAVIGLWLTLPPRRDADTYAGKVLQKRWVKTFLIVAGLVIYHVCVQL